MSFLCLHKIDFGLLTTDYEIAFCLLPTAYYLASLLHSTASVRHADGTTVMNP